MQVKTATEGKTKDVAITYVTPRKLHCTEQRTTFVSLRY